MAQPLLFDFYESIITVPAPDTVLEMQWLIDQIRANEEKLVPGIGYPQIAEAAGKFDLGGGIYTGITVKLLGSWRVKFEDRLGPEYELMTITGGNLVGGPLGNPVAPSSYVQVLQQQSAAGTIAVPSEVSELTNIKYLVSSLSETSKSIGTIFYWDPLSGNDESTGLQPNTALRTFAKCHEKVTPGAGNIIFCMATDPSGQTTASEQILITKAGLKLRGPGHIFRLIPNVVGSPGITITGDNVELSGLYIAGHPSGSTAVSISGDACVIKDCWFGGSQNHNIQLTTSKLSRIFNCVIESAVNDGIRLTNGTTQCLIRQCIISECSNGINLTGTSLEDNVVERSLIYNNAQYGVTVGTNVLRTYVHAQNTIINNIAGNTRDNGTATYIEVPAGGSSASEIADAVWDEVIASHATVSGAAGKVLKDIKTRATLASISK
jgi:hypothetical protein